MNGLPAPNINLATRPFRNRRFFFAAAAGLTILMLLLGRLGLGSLVRYKGSQKKAAVEIARIESNLQKLDGETNVRDIELKGLLRANKDKVDLVNRALMMKGFSWVDFFTLLEDALPASSYISSMAPVTAVDGRFELRFKVVSSSMGDTLQLVQNLTAATGRVPFVLNEVRTGGQYFTEITLTYEKVR
jgi:hypothetical protein